MADRPNTLNERKGSAEIPSAFASAASSRSPQWWMSSLPANLSSSRTIYQQRHTAFEIIFMQLCKKATAGNTRALKVVKMYMDFAASRDSSDGIRLEIVDDTPRPKQQGGENG